MPVQIKVFQNFIWGGTGGTHILYGGRHVPPRGYATDFNASNQISITIYYNLITYVLYQLENNRNKAFFFFLYFIEICIHIFEDARIGLVDFEAHILIFIILFVYLT